MSWQAQNPKWAIGGTSLIDASVTPVASTANGTSYTVGKGMFLVKVVVTSIEIASNTEKFGIIIQANTVAASSTWTEIGMLFLGPAEVNATGVDDVADTYWFAVYNQGDYQMRVRTVVGGDVGEGIYYTCDIYPLATTNA